MGGAVNPTRGEWYPGAASQKRRCLLVGLSVEDRLCLKMNSSGGQMGCFKPFQVFYVFVSFSDLMSLSGICPFGLCSLCASYSLYNILYPAATFTGVQDDLQEG